MVPTYAPLPLVVASGEGPWLWDSAGKKYLDFAGGIGVNLLGHCHPKVVAAIQAQAARLCHTSNAFLHRGHIEVCERLSLLCGNGQGDNGQVFLTNSGTEAIEAALKCVRRYQYLRAEKGHTRTRLVTASGGFHGRSMGGLSLTGQAKLQEGFGPMLDDVVHVPFGDLAALEAAMGPHPAGVFLEPIQGNGGVQVAPEGYLSGVQDLCRRLGALFVADEIQTGMGRTGKWWAYEHDNVHPDLVAVAKPLGGGLPLGAMVAQKDIAAALDTGKHGTTFGGNPVACAAALATLDVLEGDDLIPKAAALGAGWMQRLEALMLRFADRLKLAPADIPGRVRGRGLIVGMEVGEHAKAIRLEATKRGFLCVLAGPSVLRFLPAVVMDESHLDHGAEVLADAMEAVLL